MTFHFPFLIHQFQFFRMVREILKCPNFNYSHFSASNKFWKKILLVDFIWNRETEKLKNTQDNKIECTNIGFPNGPVFRYGNFYISRVEKSSKISPRAKNLVLPRAVGPREARFFSQGLIFEDFLTRGMKKFSYLTTTAHLEIVFL